MRSNYRNPKRDIFWERKPVFTEDQVCELLGIDGETLDEWEEMGILFDRGASGLLSHQDICELENIKAVLNDKKINPNLRIDFLKFLNEE